jgi:hypothetical protein
MNVPIAPATKGDLAEQAAIKSRIIRAIESDGPG